MDVDTRPSELQTVTVVIQNTMIKNVMEEIKGFKRNLQQILTQEGIHLQLTATMSVYCRTSFHHWTTREKYIVWISNFVDDGAISCVKRPFCLCVYIYFQDRNWWSINDWNVQAKVPFLNSTVKCVRKIIHFHDTCTCTEDYNVDMDLYVMIWQLVRGAVGLCVRRMWRSHSSFVPHVVSTVRRLLTVKIKRAK